MEAVEVVGLAGWDETVSEAAQARATESLELGKVLYFPNLRFPIFPEEAHLLSPRYAGTKAKNISFDPARGELRGTGAEGEDYRMLKALLSRFATRAASLIEKFSPRYTPSLEIGRTSFRPVEIQGRASSYRKDDTRLHIDAFPSTPVQDRRILRVFSNINPDAEDRVWRVGESFEEAAKAFLSKTRRQFWAEPGILQAFSITKSRRTEYDHTMLQLHNLMKSEPLYQATAEQMEIRFPAGSTWAVFTDQVSHAAMSGQYALEQTLYLPVEAMADPSRSPLRILERLSGIPMV